MTTSLPTTSTLRPSMRPPVRDCTRRVIWSPRDSVATGRIETDILHSSMNLAHSNWAITSRQTESRRSAGSKRKKSAPLLHEVPAVNCLAALNGSLDGCLLGSQFELSGLDHKGRKFADRSPRKAWFIDKHQTPFEKIFDSCHPFMGDDPTCK